MANCGGVAGHLVISGHGPYMRCQSFVSCARERSKADIGKSPIRHIRPADITAIDKTTTPLHQRVHLFIPAEGISMIPLILPYQHRAPNTAT